MVVSAESFANAADNIRADVFRGLLTDNAFLFHLCQNGRDVLHTELD